MNLAQVLERLHELLNPEKVAFIADKFGISTENSLGIYHKNLKLLTKEIGRDTGLGIELFETGIYEARILCSKICKPTNVTEKMMDSWVTYFDTWGICDSFCMGLF
tara:strand:- start:37456 stop:37773 length:318 start_codon:yes stop_codon:yes gene_type:complete